MAEGNSAKLITVDRLKLEMFRVELPENCDELIELLSAYVDGNATPVERSMIDSHLSHCSECALFVQFVKLSGTVIRQEPAPQAPFDLKYKILSATLRPAATPNRPFALSKFSLPGLVSASAGAFAILLTFGVGKVGNIHPIAVVKGSSPIVAPRTTQKVEIAKSPDVVYYPNSDNGSESSVETTEMVTPVSTPETTRIQTARYEISPIVSNPLTTDQPSSGLNVAPESVENSVRKLKVVPHQVSEEKSSEPTGSMVASAPTVIAKNDPSVHVPAATPKTESVIASAPNEGHMVLTASSGNSDAMDSLAALRSTLRRDEAVASAEAVRLVPTKVLWDVYKSHF